MLHVLYGNDEFRTAEALRELRRELDQDGMLANNTSELAGRGLKPDTLIQHASAVPFLGGARLVIVDGLLAAATGRGVTDTWRPFLDFVPQMPETSHVVLREQPPRQRDRGGERGPGASPLLRALRGMPNVTVTEFRELRPYASRGEPNQVLEWLAARARERGARVEPAALNELVELIGANLRLLATELEKLQAYAGDRAVTVEDVRLLTAQSREQSVFALVDAVVEGRAPLALRTMRTMLDDGSHSPPQLQAMIARQLRALVRATELLERRAGQPEVAQATGLNGYPLTKLLTQARATSRPAVEQALREVETSDHAVKTGRLDDALALELLVTRLAALVSAGQGAGARR